MGFCFSWYRKARNDNLIVMDACCEAKSEEIEKLKADHKKVLKIVLTINVLLFIVEVTAGFVAHSTALLAERHHGQPFGFGCGRRRFLFQGGLARRCSGRSHRRTVFPDRARGLKRVGPRVSRAPA